MRAFARRAPPARRRYIFEIVGPITRWNLDQFQGVHIVISFGNDPLRVWTPEADRKKEGLMSAPKECNGAIRLLGVLLKLVRLVTVPLVRKSAKAGRQIRRVGHAQGLGDNVAHEVPVAVLHKFLVCVALAIARSVI